MSKVEPAVKKQSVPVRPMSTFKERSKLPYLLLMRCRTTSLLGGFEVDCLPEHATIEITRTISQNLFILSLHRTFHGLQRRSSVVLIYKRRMIFQFRIGCKDKNLINKRRIAYPPLLTKANFLLGLINSGDFSAYISSGQRHRSRYFIEITAVLT